MKKENNAQKKLSLKKVQIMKINDLKRIHGGYGGNGNQASFDENGEVDPNTPIKHTIKP
ncbi:hypothetical protein [Chryseobacterium sp. T20]|uniref:hypothetical protein n=1 Tax=Chryseobacterium sp. T20 TaxID=3395375 RepID=UPI0039BC6B90